MRHVKDVKAEPLRRRPSPSCNIVLKAKKRKMLSLAISSRVRAHDAPLLGSVNDEPFGSSRAGQQSHILVILKLSPSSKLLKLEIQPSPGQPARPPEAPDPVTAEQTHQGGESGGWWILLVLLAVDWLALGSGGGAKKKKRSTKIAMQS